MNRLMIFYLFIVLISCDKDKPDNVTLPTNLITNIQINNGALSIQASADNSNFYSFMFYEGNDSIYIESQDGLAEYTYSTSGTYEIKVKAHATSSDYIEKIESIVINIQGSSNGGIPTSGYSTPLSYSGYTLVWNDEFDGSSLSNDWIYELGNGTWGWGNNELEYYRQENTLVENGILTITAKEELFGGYNYTSSRIKTQGNRSFKYGRIDIRAALPYGQGIWPALWMLGDNISSVGWPACGEIDIMELIGGSGTNDRTVHGTLHWDQNGHANYGGSSTLSSGKYADEWHVFSIIWDANQIRFLRDDIQYHAMNISGPELTEFHQNFFFIFNVAVGGNWPGSPDNSTEFPQQMYVDYVRVFQ